MLENIALSVANGGPDIAPTKVVVVVVVVVVEIFIRNYRKPKLL